MEIKYEDKIAIADRAHSIMLNNVLTPGAIFMMPLGFELTEKDCLDILLTLSTMNKESFASRCTAIVDKYSTKDAIMVSELCISQILYSIYGKGIIFKFRY